jgi:hypothetical protein
MAETRTKWFMGRITENGSGNQFAFKSRSRSRSYFTTVSQSVCLGIEYPCGTCGQILFPVGMLLSEICGLVSVARPLWREDGSPICSVITQWSESRRTRNHTLLSHLRPPTWRARFPYSCPPRHRVAQLTENMAVGISRADQATPSIRKSWH